MRNAAAAAAQEKNQKKKEVRDRQVELDPPVRVQPACHIGLVSVTDTGDITDQIGESKENEGGLRESSLERVSL
jgi:hypothetical protein